MTIRLSKEEVIERLEEFLDMYQTPKFHPIGWTDHEYELVEDWTRSMRRAIREIIDDSKAAECENAKKAR